MINVYPYKKFLAFAPELCDAYRIDEAHAVKNLARIAHMDEAQLTKTNKLASKLIEKVRAKRLHSGGLDAFLTEYDLSSEEGIALMCLAEALLRIPDALTADKLIADKISVANWESHLGESHSLFVNAATWSLVLTGKVLNKSRLEGNALSRTFNTLLAKQGSPVIRQALKQAMKIMGNQFVLGQTIKSALNRAKKTEALGYRHSYDMLGEAAKTEEDAARYMELYRLAIHSIGESNRTPGIYQSAGVSIKLSALLARYEVAQIERVHSELLPRAKELMLLAKSYDIGLTIDAEETERLQLSLSLIEMLAKDPDLKDWQGLGLAVQAYQKRAPYVLYFLLALSEKTQRRFMVRLVKGAYWDTEVKHSQEQGLDGYPVFTRKVYTDVSYLACAKILLNYPKAFYPQFATHNAYSLAAVLAIAGEERDFEFQCLHGMGDSLYDHVVGKTNLNIPCRIYAPVGGHEYLLGYLVRRLLENGANSSFVNRIIDEKIPIDELVQDPIAQALALQCLPHPHIPLPRNLYGERMNSQGIDLSNTSVLEKLATAMSEASAHPWRAGPMIAASRSDRGNKPITLLNPANYSEVVGQVIQADEHDVELALQAASEAYGFWSRVPANERAECLEVAASLLEKHMPHLMAIAVKEAGKTIPNAVGEVREAIDFCRYYAQEARRHFGNPINLPGPTGEKNQLVMRGRGTVVCITPWNFPLAIFLGEVTAALASGNTVIAKPATQTPLIAAAAVAILHQAGIPREVLQLLPGKGSVVGAKLISDPRVAGVIFTGSNETAQQINLSLAKRNGAIGFLIAETGGQNTMVVDSSALPEQVVTDAITSAFDSAGQRCSALRVLYLQEEIADKIIAMLKGAMDELKVGDPSFISTDVGPVIDEGAKTQLLNHIQHMKQHAKLIHEVKLSEHLNGTFIAPIAFEIPSISMLKREVFGPVLHIIRYKAKELSKVVDEINSTGYGLTFGIHSRINETVRYLQENVHVGNIYVNRNTVGAVVGVQPFGGEGLSGTGPKAGGPFYLPRLAIERVICVNTTAAGGNASLMSLQEDT